MSTHIKFKTKNIDLHMIYRYPNTSMLNFIVSFRNNRRKYTE